MKRIQDNFMKQICRTLNLWKLIPLFLIPFFLHSLCGNDYEDFPPVKEMGIPGGTLNFPKKLTRISLPVNTSVGTSRESYYAITGLTPGNSYSAIISNMEDNVDLYLYDSDATFSTVACSSTNTGVTDDTCAFTATGTAVFIKIIEKSTMAKYDGITYTIGIE